MKKLFNLKEKNKVMGVSGYGLIKAKLNWNEIAQNSRRYILVGKEREA